MSSDLQQAIASQIAALAMLGTPQTQIAKTLGVDHRAVKKVMQTPEFREALKNQAEESVTEAKATLRAKTKNIAPEVWDTIVKLIRSDSGKDNAEGLRAYFRLIKLDGDEDAGQAPLIINLPSPKQETVIQVKEDE